MRRVVLRCAAAGALSAAVIFAGGAARLHAQAQSAARETAARAAAAASARNAAQALVIAGGAEYADVRALATDAAGGLYISLAQTPAPADCVRSAIAVPQTAANGAAQNSAAGAAQDASRAAKIPLTIFSNCTLARSEDPSGIAVTLGGNVYLANRAQNSVRLLDMATGKVSAVPAAAENAAAANLRPYQPAGLAVDRGGNLYVADRGNNRVLEIAPGAREFSYVAHALDAAALAVNPAGDEIFAASPAANRVFAIDLRTGAVNAFAGSGAAPESGQAGAGLSANPLDAAIGAPEGVAADGAGNVFIADTGANAILRVDAATGKLSRVATNANLSAPGALAIDRAGDLFVADRGNARVLEFAGVAAPQAAGAVTLSPASFDFGDEPTGGTTAAEQFTLTNNGTSALALNSNSFAFSGADAADFAQTNNCVPSLGAGASCLINVTFTPAGTGARTATLAVTDADPSSPQTAALSGTGDDFQLTAASQVDTVQNVAPGQSATYSSLSVTPDNTFSGTVTLACPLHILGDTNDTIKCTVNPSSVTLTPGQAQNFTVTLTTGGPNATRLIPFAPWNGPDGARRILLLGVLAMALALCAFYARRATAAQGIASSATDATRMNDAAAARRTRARRAAIFFAMLAAAAAAGCKGSSTPYNPNETSAGSYAIDITGTAQNASRSITLTLNVD